MGPVPQFLPHELGVPEEQCNLRAVMERARSVLKDRNQLTWQYVGRTNYFGYTGTNHHPLGLA